MYSLYLSFTVFLKRFLFGITFSCFSILNLKFFLTSIWIKIQEDHKLWAPFHPENEADSWRRIVTLRIIHLTSKNFSERLAFNFSENLTHVLNGCSLSWRSESFFGMWFLRENLVCTTHFLQKRNNCAKITSRYV